MAILELALLRLKPGVSIDATLPNLRFAEKAMQQSAGAGHAFYYYQQVEDPTLIYIVGSWPSVAYHYDVFIPSAENKQALELMKDQMGVEWLIHVDVDPKSIQPGLDTPMIAIARHFIKDGEPKELFDTTFASSKPPLIDATEGKLVGGWRLDKELDGGRDEWVLFTGWGSLEDHATFGNSEEFKRYAKIRDHLASFEVRHAQLLTL
ncbi:hypothetical protein BDZ89DRAFT_1069152 [Hymenopellis radicata]|nr:hypothetical protein BDZ89DRAFT_1069152 [Hymenopellis radicata]